MASKLLRRSGLSVGLIAELLEFVPDAIYQVGVGQYCEEIDVFKEIWPHALLFGCEPHPQIYKSIQERYWGVLFNVAIGAAEGETVLYGKKVHKDGTTVHRPDNPEDFTTWKAQVTTLDAKFPSGPPSLNTLLWLDCEGSELAVLEGAPSFLNRVAMINVELTAKPISRAWCDHRVVHEHLLKLGFKRQWTHTNRLNAGQYDGIYVRPRLFRPCYCCCPCQSQESCG